MVPPPTVIGLMLCDYVIVEEGTKKASLIGAFSSIRATRFPVAPALCAYAALTDGLGDAAVDLVVTEAASDEEIYRLVRTIHFPDKLTEVRALFRIRDCSFPAAGSYLFTLLIDNEWVAQRSLRVYTNEETP
jgi:hypothetical protein